MYFCCHIYNIESLLIGYCLYFHPWSLTYYNIPHIYNNNNNKYICNYLEFSSLKWTFGFVNQRRWYETVQAYSSKPSLMSLHKQIIKTSNNNTKYKKLTGKKYIRIIHPNLHFCAKMVRGKNTKEHNWLWWYRWRNGVCAGVLNSVAKWRLIGVKAEPTHLSVDGCLWCNSWQLCLRLPDSRDGRFDGHRQRQQR